MNHINNKDTGLFQPYDTKLESEYIIQYLIKNKAILNLSNIAKKCGIERHTLIKLSNGKLQTISDSTLPILTNVLKELEFSIPPRRITVEYIQKKISKISGYSLDDMKLKQKPLKVTEERQIIMYLSKELIPRITLKVIGDHFGTSKSNVLSSIRVVKTLLNIDKKLKEKVDWYLKLFSK